MWHSLARCGLLAAVARPRLGLACAPTPAPRLGLPQTDSDCFAGLSIGEHVHSSESGNALQNPKCLHLGLPSNLVIDTLRRSRKSPYTRKHDCSLRLKALASTPSLAPARASARTV